MNNNNNSNNNNTLRASIKCVKQPRSPAPQQAIESTTNTKSATKRSLENSNEQQQQSSESVKRARLSSRPSDENLLNSNRIVLRIRKPSEDLSSSRNELSNGNNNNSSSSHQLSAQIKEPLTALPEDEEDQNESQSQTKAIFDIINQIDQTTEPSKSENQ